MNSKYNSSLNNIIYLYASAYLTHSIFQYYHSDSEITVHVSYEDIYRVLVFLISTYVAGLITKSLGMPALVGEIFTGFLVSLSILIMTASYTIHSYMMYLTLALAILLFIF